MNKKSKLFIIFFFLGLFFLKYNLTFAYTSNPIHWHSSTLGSSATSTYDTNGDNSLYTFSFCSSGCYLHLIESVTGNQFEVSSIKETTYNNYGTWTQNYVANYMPTASEGYYMLVDIGSANYYQIIAKQSGLVQLVPFPIALASGISLNSPTAMTYVNNPIPFAGRYINTNTYNQIQYEINYTTTGTQINATNTTINLANGIFDWSNYITLPYAGNYTAKVRLYDSNTASTTEWSNTISFGISSTTNIGLYESMGFDSLAFGYEYQTCSSYLDFVCGGKNLIIWAFIPKEINVTNVKNISFASSTPFSYLYDTPNLINDFLNIDTTATSSLSIDLKFPEIATSTLELISENKLKAIPFAGTLKNILSGLMYLMTGLTIYVIIKNIFMKH